LSEAVSSGKAAAEVDQEEEEEEKEEEEIVCVVCLHPFTAEEPPTALACRHDFHAGCIEGWRESCAVRGWKWSCPMCRQG
jgi:E3 ubiquitin-protein ligase SDIR1